MRFFFLVICLGVYKEGMQWPKKSLRFFSFWQCVGIYKRMNGNERYILLLSPYILIMFERNMNKNVILMREIECFTHFWVEHSKGSEWNQPSKPKFSTSKQRNSGFHCFLSFLSTTQQCIQMHCKIIKCNCSSLLIYSLTYEMPRN